MAVEIVMPKMGLTMTVGSVGKWLKKEGDQVTKGEHVAEVLTEKITNLVDAPADGVLRIAAPEGTTLPIGGVMGYVGAAGEASPPAAGPPSPPPEARRLPPRRPRRRIRRLKNGRYRPWHGMAQATSTTRACREPVPTEDHEPGGATLRRRSPGPFPPPDLKRSPWVSHAPLSGGLTNARTPGPAIIGDGCSKLERPR